MLLVLEKNPTKSLHLRFISLYIKLLIICLMLRVARRKNRRSLQGNMKRRKSKKKRKNCSKNKLGSKIYKNKKNRRNCQKIGQIITFSINMEHWTLQHQCFLKAHLSWCGTVCQPPTNSQSNWKSNKNSTIQQLNKTSANTGIFKSINSYKMPYSRSQKPTKKPCTNVR